MALNASGPISLGGATAGQSINLELGLSATAQIGLNDAAVRTLLGVASGAITLNNAYSKSNTTYYYAYMREGTTNNKDTGQILPMSDGNILATGTLHPDSNQNFLNKITSSTFTLSYSKKNNGQMGALSYYGTAPSTVYSNKREGFNDIGYAVKRISNITSSPSEDWYRNISGNYTSASYRWRASMKNAVDSSTNLYLGLYAYNENGTFGHPLIVKLDTGGTVVNTAYSNSYVGRPEAMTINPTSGRLIVVWDQMSGGWSNGMLVSVFNSNLTYYADYSYTGIGFYPRAVIADSSSNTYYYGTMGDGFPSLTKMNSAGTQQWGINTPYTGSGNSAAGPWSVKLSPDETFVYLTYSTSVSSLYSFQVVKVRASDGVVQWHRVWSINSGWTFYNGNEIPSNNHLFVTSDAVYVGGQVSAGSSGTVTAFYAKLKPDGSGTGSYSGPSSTTLTYGTSSATWDSWSFTGQTSFDFTFNSVGGNVTVVNEDAGPGTFSDTGYGLTTGVVS
jgi:hypothetical protein